MLRLLRTVVVLLCLACTGAAAQMTVIIGGAPVSPGTSVIIEETDGTPTGSFTTLKVSPGSLTNNGDGSATLVTGAAALGYTPEDINNKKSEVILGTSNVFYPTQGAVKSYVDAGLAAKQATLGFTPEDVARKNASAALGPSNTDYPTQGAVKEYIDNGVKALTNTALTPRPCTGANTATITMNADNLTGCDFVQVAELSQPTTFDLTTAPPPTYVNGQFLSLLIFTTTQRALTFTTGAGKFAAEGIPLPTFSRTAGYVLYGFRYNALSNRWALAASNQETNYGLAGYVQTAGGPGVAPSWQPPAGGLAGTIGTIHLPMSAAWPMPTNFAVFDGAEANGRLLFDGGAISECSYWGPFRMNSDYASTPVFKFQYSMSSSNTGGVAIAVYVMTAAANAGVDMNNDALYGTVNTCTQTPVPSTIGDYKEISCALTNNDGMAANRFTKIKLCRATSDAIDTNTTSDLEGLTAALEYTRGDGGGGGGTFALGGTAGQVQYHGGAALGGSSGLTFDGTSVLTRKDAVTAVSADTTLGAHNIVLATTGSGAGVTLTLPAAAAPTVGQYVVVKADDTLGDMRVLPAGADLINTRNGFVSTNMPVSGFRLTWLSASAGWLAEPLNMPLRMEDLANGVTGTGFGVLQTSPLVLAGDTLEVAYTLAGHVEYRGTTPTVAIGAADCGTTPTMSGNDVLGKVTVGTTPGGKCTLTFATPWSQAPLCWCQNTSTAQLCRVANATTTTAELTGTLAAGNVVAFGCAANY